MRKNKGQTLMLRVSLIKSGDCGMRLGKSAHSTSCNIVQLPSAHCAGTGLEVDSTESHMLGPVHKIGIRRGTSITGDGV